MLIASAAARIVDKILFDPRGYVTRTKDKRSNEQVCGNFAVDLSQGIGTRPRQCCFDLVCRDKRENENV
jgi:hypothetical protein